MCFSRRLHAAHLLYIALSAYGLGGSRTPKLFVLSEADVPILLQGRLWFHRDLHPEFYGLNVASVLVSLWNRYVYYTLLLTRVPPSYLLAFLEHLCASEFV